MTNLDGKPTYHYYLPGDSCDIKSNITVTKYIKKYSDMRFMVKTKKVCYMNITLSHFLSNITIRIHNNPLITMYTTRAFICGWSKDYVFLKISSFTNSVLIRYNTVNRRKSRVINWLHFLLNNLFNGRNLTRLHFDESFQTNYRKYCEIGLYRFYM